MQQGHDGLLLSPRQVAAGFVRRESRRSARNGSVVWDLDGAKSAVGWYAENRYPRIKIYDSFPTEHLATTAAYAHLKGLKFSGHVSASMREQGGRARL